MLEYLKKHKLAVKILLAIVCFVYLFNPRFVSTDLRKVIDVVCFLGVLYYSVVGTIRINVLTLKSFDVLFLFGFYLLVGTFLHILFDWENVVAYVSNAYEILSVFFRCFFVSCFFLFVIRNLNYSWNDMTDVFIFSGCFQLACVVLAFVLPDVKSFFNELTIANSESAYVAFSTQYNSYRSFGLGENLFDSFGYVIALVILLTFIEGLFRSDTKIIILSGLMMVMPLLNARTGMVLAFIGLLVSFVMYTKRSFLQFLKIVFFVAFLLVVGSFFFRYIPESTQEWILEGGSSISGLIFEHNSSGVFSILSNQILFPNSFIFGEFGSPEMFGLGHSDIGYIQCMWRYGAMGSILLFCGYAKLLMCRTILCRNDRLKMFAVCVLFMLFVYLFKMFPFTNLGATFIILSYAFGAGLKNEFETL